VLKLEELFEAPVGEHSNLKIFDNSLKIEIGPLPPTYR